MDFTHHILQLLHRPVRTPEQPLTFGRERDRTVPAHQQLHTQLRFQRVDLSTDRRLGKAQVLRRERDAHATPDRDEAPNQIERRETNQW